MSTKNQEIALIIGGSEGMGKETAKLLASRGVNLWLVARSIDKLNETKAEISSASNVSVDVSSVDLYKDDQVNNLINEINSSKEVIKYLSLIHI